MEMTEAEKKQARRLMAEGCRYVRAECPECKDDWPSVNWKNGKSYGYCWQCGEEEPH